MPCKLSIRTALLLFPTLLGAQAAHFNLDVTDFEADVRGAFTNWAAHHGKSYTQMTAEFEQRLAQWKENVEDLVSQQNSQTVAVNGLMDLDDEEFRQSYLGHSRRTANSLLGAEEEEDTGKASLEYRYRYVEPAESVDWRQAGIVGPIKNQHVNGSKCGCCWSFATIAVVESINAMATGQMDVLSEQQLIDCDRSAPYYDLGCQGGDFEGGMKYIIDHSGIALESEYPYLAADGPKCDHRAAHHKVVTIDAVEDVPGGNETALMQAVTMHPVGIGLCVGPWIKEWRAYTGGILTVPENCEDPQDHAMPVVGYGTQPDGQKFWLLKNSWGEQWGEAGFLKLVRGMPGNGSLGLAANPGYPVKISANPSHHHHLEQGVTDRFGSWMGSLLGRRALLSQ